MSQAEDMEAINRYIAESKPKTEEAAEVRDDWIRWWDGLTWWEKSMDGDIYDQARNRRTDFNRANAVTQKEKETVEKNIKSGVTTEQMEGGTSRQMSSGKYAEDLVSKKTVMQIATVGAVVGGLYAIKKIWLDRVLKYL